MSQNQFKIMQAVIYITLLLIWARWSDKLSLIAECFIFLLMVLTLALNKIVEYVKQWKTKKCIENKKKLVLDIFLAVVFFFALSFHSILKYYKM